MANINLNLKFVRKLAKFSFKYGFYKIIIIIVLSYGNSAYGTQTLSEKPKVFELCNIKQILNENPLIKAKASISKESLDRVSEGCVAMYLLPHINANKQLILSISKEIINDSVVNLAKNALEYPEVRAAGRIIAIFNSYLALNRNSEAIEFVEEILNRIEGEQETLFTMLGSLVIPIFAILNDGELSSLVSKMALGYKDRKESLSLLSGPRQLFFQAYTDLFEATKLYQNREYFDLIKIRSRWLRFLNRPSVRVVKKILQISDTLNKDAALLYCLGGYGASYIKDFDLATELFDECVEYTNKIKSKLYSNSIKSAISMLEKNITTKISGDILKLPFSYENIELDSSEVFDSIYPYYIFLLSSSIEIDTVTFKYSRKPGLVSCKESIKYIIDNSSSLTPKMILLSSLMNVVYCYEQIDDKGGNENVIQDMSNILSYFDGISLEKDWRVEYARNLFSRKSENDKFIESENILKKVLSNTQNNATSIVDASFSIQSLSELFPLYLDQFVNEYGCGKVYLLDDLITSYKRYIYSGASKNQIYSEKARKNTIDVNLYYTSNFFISLLKDEFGKIKTVCQNISGKNIYSILNKGIRFKKNYTSSIIGLDQILLENDTRKIRISPHGELLNIKWSLLRDDDYLVLRQPVVVNISNRPHGVTKTFIKNGKDLDFDDHDFIKQIGEDILLINAHGVDSKNIYDFSIKLEDEKKTVLTISQLIELTQNIEAVMFIGCGFGKTGKNYYDISYSGAVNIGIYQEFLRSGVDKMIITLDESLTKSYASDFIRSILIILKNGYNYQDAFFKTLKKIIKEQHDYDDPWWGAYTYVE